ncbi:putative transcription factor & chromatin remodeling ARID family [Helianthus annuus]|uniref:Putative ARID DNA-binding domain-containing protein n=1 Tax=Helianthus annuus TaxID=4232 RepID=A0A251TWU4_HELAN|nr:putative transcription factor & chromatin remodeling ARID family [Helianthus annuus]KAJ0526135.1 putative transcription factor & chromatin remodeling ARID family [Helianthus annuus]KAJ0707575.1 putative transcription factor & chromatin remodeling ARID family [Helianthus annuus]
MLKDCIRLLDLIEEINEPWTFRDQIKERFLQMVDWFLHFYLRILGRPIPPLYEKGKRVELYDLYGIVKKEGGHIGEYLSIIYGWLWQQITG